MDQQPHQREEDTDPFGVAPLADAGEATRPMEPITPADPAAATRPMGSSGEGQHLSDYPPPPPVRSAYPTAAEGGLSMEGVRQPDPGAPPGPGYDDTATSTGAPVGTSGQRPAWMLPAILLALLLGLGTILGLARWPALITVIAIVVAAAAAVLSVATGGAVRRHLLVSAAGPLGVLVGYWVVTLFRG